MTINALCSQEKLKFPGQLWINKKTSQLRYFSKNEDITPQWIMPLSVYQVAADAPAGQAFIKYGQPVSIAFLDEIEDDDLKIKSDPCVTRTDPKKHQWSIGIQMEAGNAHNNDPKNIGNIRNHIHVASHGQVKYTLDSTSLLRDLIYQPPNDGTRYLWTYNDIGKSVMVSNVPGHIGELTIDITEAYYNGSNIITVGRIADAPVADISANDEQSITIEVQLAGDTRGLVDSTEFDVHIENIDLPAELPGPFKNREVDTVNDRIIFVKLYNLDGEPRGRMILSDDILLEDGGINTPLGAFVVKQGDNLRSFKDQNVLVHRLGVLDNEKLEYSDSDFGKEVFLNNGLLTTSSAAEQYEYKVGIILDNHRILIDCRYPKFIAKQEAIGTIKPAYKSESGNTITDPGFVVVDPNVVHAVDISRALNNDPDKNIDFQKLVEYLMYKGQIEVSTVPITNQNNSSYTFRDVTGADDITTLRQYAFRFKDAYYRTTDGDVLSQIKYTTEGSPTTMQYLWPEMSFDFSYEPGEFLYDVTTKQQNKFRWDITPIAMLGAYIDGKGRTAEDYDVHVQYLHPTDKTTMPLVPEGFYTTPEGIWLGYSWSVEYDPNTTKTWLRLYNKPGDSISANICKGLGWPIGQIITITKQFRIWIRRRPTQHHGLYINQLNNNNPFAPHIVDNRNLVTTDTLYFGDAISGDIWHINELYGNSFVFNELPVYQDLNNVNHYEKELIYNFGPHYDPNVNPNVANTISKVYQKFIAWNWYDDQNHYSGITWEYDLEKGLVFLNAEFGPKLIVPSTSRDVIYETTPEVISGHWVDYYDTYNSEITLTNISGKYTTKRSALKTLHEVPNSFFNYSDDVNLTLQKISTIQQNWFQSIVNGEYDFEKFVPFNENRRIFPFYVSGTTTVNGFEKGNLYKLQIQSSNIYGKGEADHIQEEIKYLFAKISTQDGSWQSGGETQYIQTNLGLLNSAAKETQDRLLRLELATMGVDYPELPKGLQEPATPAEQETYAPWIKCLDRGGLLRIINDLFESKLIKNNFTTNPQADKAYTSKFQNIQYEFYTDYSSKEEYVASGEAFGPDQIDYDNTYHEMYIWYKNFGGSIPYIYNYNNMSFSEILNPIFGPGIIAQDKVYMRQPIKSEKYRGGPYTYWPIDGSIASWKGRSVFENWFEAKIFGEQDNYAATPDENGKKLGTFQSQSVEGFLQDTIHKLSLLKRFTSRKHLSLSPQSTLLNLPYTIEKRYEGAPWFELVGLENLEFRNFTEHRRSLITDQYSEYLNGYYNAIGMRDNKINSLYGVTFTGINFPLNQTNKDLPGIDLVKWYAGSTMGNSTEYKKTKPAFYKDLYVPNYYFWVPPDYKLISGKYQQQERATWFFEYFDETTGLLYQPEWYENIEYRQGITDETNLIVEDKKISGIITDALPNSVPDIFIDLIPNSVAQKPIRNNIWSGNAEYNYFSGDTWYYSGLKYDTNGNPAKGYSSPWLQPEGHGKQYDPAKGQWEDVNEPRNIWDKDPSKKDNLSGDNFWLLQEWKSPEYIIEDPVWPGDRKISGVFIREPDLDKYRAEWKANHNISLFKADRLEVTSGFLDRAVSGIVVMPDVSGKIFDHGVSGKVSNPKSTGTLTNKTVNVSLNAGILMGGLNEVGVTSELSSKQSTGYITGNLQGHLVTQITLNLNIPANTYVTNITTSQDQDGHTVVNQTKNQNTDYTISIPTSQVFTLGLDSPGKQITVNLPNDLTVLGNVNNGDVNSKLTDLSIATAEVASDEVKVELDDPQVSGYVIDPNLSGFLVNPTVYAELDEKSFSGYIHRYYHDHTQSFTKIQRGFPNFYLSGLQIPNDYISFIKLRGEQHVLDQIHEVGSERPTEIQINNETYFNISAEERALVSSSIKKYLLREMALYHIEQLFRVVTVENEAYESDPNNKGQSWSIEDGFDTTKPDPNDPNYVDPERMPGDDYDPVEPPPPFKNILSDNSYLVIVKSINFDSNVKDANNNPNESIMYNAGLIHGNLFYLAPSGKGENSNIVFCKMRIVKFIGSMSPLFRGEEARRNFLEMAFSDTNDFICPVTDYIDILQDMLYCCDPEREQPIDFESRLALFNEVTTFTDYFIPQIQVGFGGL